MSGARHTLTSGRITRTMFPRAFMVRGCLIAARPGNTWRVILPDGETYGRRNTFREAVRAARAMPDYLLAIR
jgi:hypothetical protein